MTWWPALRPSLRALRRAPVYASASVGLLATTAAAVGTGFALARTAFFEPAPYRDVDRLVSIMASTDESCGAECPDLLSGPAYQAVQSESRSFERLALFRWIDVAAPSISPKQRIAGAAVDPALFAMLGVAAKVGRTLSEGDNATRRHGRSSG